MSTIELDRIPGEDYYPSSADTFSIFVTLTHGEQVKFKLKFKTEEEAKQFLERIHINRNKAGEPTFTQEVVGKKIVLKTTESSGNYASLEIDSRSFDLYMSLRRQYTRQMLWRIKKIEKSDDHEDYQTTYTLRN